MTRKDIMQLLKRFLITFCCTIPLMIAVGFLLKNKISNFVMVVIYVVIAGAVLAVEEYIYYKKRVKREQLKEELKNKRSK